MRSERTKVSPHGLVVTGLREKGAVLAAPYRQDALAKKRAVYIKQRYEAWPFRWFSEWHLHAS